MAYSKAIITRRDWVQQAGVVLSNGSWSASLPLANILTMQPQQVAQAASNASASTKFDCDLGATRKVGIIEFQRLVTTTAGTIRVRAGTDATFASNNYDSGTISSWPLDTSPWGDGATKYNATEYANLGYPRFFIPPAIIDCRYIRVEIVDTGASPPLQIGHFGAWESWEFTFGFDDSASFTPLDEAEVTRVEYGSTFVTPRGHRRQMKLPFQWIDAAANGDFIERVLGIATIKGLSEPLVIVPFPADGSNVERTAVWGTLTEPVEFVRHNYRMVSATFSMEQLI